MAEAQLFAIDVNGTKGPNKWGHDLFSFNFLLAKSLLKLKMEIAALPKVEVCRSVLCFNPYTGK